MVVTTMLTSRTISTKATGTSRSLMCSLKNLLRSIQDPLISSKEKPNRKRKKQRSRRLSLKKRRR